MSDFGLDLGGANTNEISEQKHKKELAMIRFGLTKEPKAFSYLLKDYDENGKIK
jgi:uncharacterized hydantoinase/oxoprolinase family protein